MRGIALVLMVYKVSAFPLREVNCTPKVRHKTFGVQFNVFGNGYSFPSSRYW